MVASASLDHARDGTSGLTLAVAIGLQCRAAFSANGGHTEDAYTTRARSLKTRL
jgi:hypothetical protein